MTFKDGRHWCFDVESGRGRRKESAAAIVDRMDNRSSSRNDSRSEGKWRPLRAARRRM